MSTKDYKYIVAILGLVIITIFTYYFGGKGNDIVSYLGFAGTITSIILSILAMIYTFFNSVTSISQAQKLTDTSEKFIASLKDFQSIQDQVTSAFESVGLISQQVAKVDERIIDLKNNMDISGSVVTLNSDITESEITNSLKSISAAGLVMLHLLRFQYKYPKEMSFKELLNQLEIHGEKVSYDYAHGFLIGYCSTGFISIDWSKKLKVEISKPELFEKLLDEVYSENIINGKKDGFDIYSEGYEAVIKMYSE